MRFRLIDTDLAHPYYVTAADEAISTARKLGIVPNTVHLYRRDPPAVSMGRFRSVKEINVERCKKEGIVIVRRVSGGGNIFTDKGCLIYSLICKDFFADKPESVFEKVCCAICRTIESFGLKAVYKKPNDVLVNGKKVSGSAILKKADVTLVHGTIIVSGKVSLAKEVLPRGKVEITSLSKEACKEIDVEKVKEKLLEIFKKDFDIEIEKGSLTNFEKNLIQYLIEKKFSRDEWNLRW